MDGTPLLRAWRQALALTLCTCAAVADGVCDGNLVRSDQLDGSYELRCVEAGVIGAWAENGDYALHRPDGSVALRGALVAGAREGRFEMLDEDGRVVAEQFYSLGARSGTWRWFDAGGNVIRAEAYAGAAGP